MTSTAVSQLVQAAGAHQHRRAGARVGLGPDAATQGEADRHSTI
jgi:hypothetical protein